MPLHEKAQVLKEESVNLERVRMSLIEELQAIDWYQERIEATNDESLRKILEHNRDEEKEHVTMLMEWIRKKDKTQDKAFENHD